MVQPTQKSTDNPSVGPKLHQIHKTNQTIENDDFLYKILLFRHSENYKNLLLNNANFLAISGYIWKNKKYKPLQAIERLK